MTEEELVTRGHQAKRILDEPLVIEALALIEREIIEAFHACPVRDTEGMRILQTDLRLARQFKGILQGVIQRGRLAENDLREKETFRERTLRAIRQF